MWGRNIPEWSQLRWFCYFVILFFSGPLYLLTYFLGFIISFLPIFPSRTALHNLAVYLGLGFFSRHHTLAMVYTNYFVYFFEALVLRPLRFEFVAGLPELINFLHLTQQEKKTELNLDNREDRDNSSPSSPEGPEGFLFLSAHISNIEAAGEALARACEAAAVGKYVALAKPSQFRLGQAVLGWMRGFRGIELLWTNRKDLFRAMIQLIQKGDSLGFLVDQKPQAGGIFIKFFGEHAAFPVAGPDLAVRYNLSVVHIVVVRRFPGFFSLRFAPGHGSNKNLHGAVAGIGEDRLGSAARESWQGLVFTKGLSEKEQRVAPVLAEFACWLEGIIREAPAQWFWDYRKWSRKPSA